MIYKKKESILFINRDCIIPYDILFLSLLNNEYPYFYPNIIKYLHLVQKYLCYKIVIISNNHNFNDNLIKKLGLIYKYILNIFYNENIYIHNIININKEEKILSYKKFEKYFNNKYSLYDSLMISNDIADILLSKNINICSILFQYKIENKILKKLNIYKLKNYVLLITNKWENIYLYLRFKTNNIISIYRHTKETEIEMKINIFGVGVYNIDTNIFFFNHLLTQIPVHSNIDIDLYARGDIYIDDHHLVEDVGIVFGKLMKRSLLNKMSLNRYGFYIIMEDSVSKVIIDFSNRSYLNWNVKFRRIKIGDVHTEMFKHFFNSFCNEAKCNLYISSIGENDHHKIESIFKCFSRSLKMAISRDIDNNKLFSSKEIL